jgi:hypothetical protein
MKQTSITLPAPDDFPHEPAEKELQQSSAAIGGLPQECLEEPNSASMLVVPLVISADVIMVATLLLVVMRHWLK